MPLYLRFIIGSIQKNMKNIFYSFCLIFSLCVAQKSFGQDKVFKMTPQDSIVPKIKEERVPQKIQQGVENPHIVGGNVNFQLWGDLLSLGVSPLAAYKVNERLHIGVGGTYSYIRGRALNGSLYDVSIYGGRLFLRYMVFEGIFAHVEYENHNAPITFVNTTVGGRLEADRRWVSGVLIGIDNRTKISSNTASTFGIYYNATHDKATSAFVYGSLPVVFRFGIEYEF
jgi:hypothetical protein